jgi:hypothetical protein
MTRNKAHKLVRVVAMSRTYRDTGKETSSQLVKTASVSVVASTPSPLPIYKQGRMMERTRLSSKI